MLLAEVFSDKVIFSVLLGIEVARFKKGFTFSVKVYA